MASSLSEAQVELIRTLSSDDIPIKLRCAICSKLAINAFRLPCCEQAICETCQVSLPQSCPVCEHSPLAAVDCNPNKSLRTTIRVFLRTAEKKREANRPKEAKSLAPANTDEATQHSQPYADPSNGEQSIFQLASGTAICHESQESKPHDVAVRDPTPGISKTATAGSEGGTQKNDARALYSLQAPQALENDQSEYIDEAAAKGGDEDIHHAEQTVVEGADNLGEEANDQTGYRMETGYNHMIYPTSHDFNQIQMMMAMQNGMGNQAFNGFPMMGMNMNMDPMTMQNMYMNGGFQGMGMNGMSGMNGMGGYGGGFGQGSNHNWNGSQSWSFDQDNYNQSGLGMTAGDFGNLSAGFQTGYNQVNYGQFADYRRNNFGRGRTRGRGFYGAYGRGGYQQNGAIGHHQDQSYHSQYGQAIQPSAPVESETRQDTGDTQQTVEDGHTGQLGNEERQDTENKAGDGVSEEAARRGSGQLASRENLGNDASGDVARKGIQAGEAGAIRSVLSTPDVPINAPTGPKAMRQGLPNTSLHHLRARGYQVDAAPASPATAAGAQQQQTPGGDKAAGGRSRSPEREREKPMAAADDGPVRDGAQPASHDVHEAGGHDRPARSRDGSPPASRRGDRNGGDSTNRSRSHSHSRSRGHRGSHRARRRPRSLSPAEAENVGQKKAAEAGHRRKKSRSRRKGGGGDRQVSRDDRRSRSASRDGTRKSGPRGSRESRDHDGRREHRDRQRDDERDRPSRRSRRERERERHRERERARGRERERERDHEQARRRDRDSNRDGNRADTGSSRRASLGTGRSASMERGPGPGPGSGAGGVPSRNSHTLERDARNRERLLKEAQRMAGLAGSKRERDADAAADAASAGRSKGRRVGQRDGHHNHHAASDEERMRRLEAERDAGRWD